MTVVVSHPTGNANLRAVLRTLGEAALAQAREANWGRYEELIRTLLTEAVR